MTAKRAQVAAAEAFELAKPGLRLIQKPGVLRDELYLAHNCDGVAYKTVLQNDNTALAVVSALLLTVAFAAVAMPNESAVKASNTHNDLARKFLVVSAAITTGAGPAF